MSAIFKTFKEKHKCAGDARSIGLMGAVELVKDKATKEPIVSYGKDPEGTMKKINGKLVERGFMTYTHENMILVAPPLIITTAQLSEELAKLDEVLGIVDGMI
jgi:taurine--2-oxoglutarate transaminase